MDKLNYFRGWDLDVEIPFKLFSHIIKLHIICSKSVLLYKRVGLS